jgi:hypothetical protein
MRHLASLRCALDARRAIGDLHSGEHAGGEQQPSDQVGPVPNEADPQRAVAMICRRRIWALSPRPSDERYDTRDPDRSRR